MKRILCLMLVALTVCSLLAACGSFDCDLCRKEKTGKKYTKEFLGEEIVYCQDCKDSADQLKEGVEDIKDGLGDLVDMFS